MKDKNLIIKVDDEFLEKVDYIERINGYKNKSDTVRKTIEKEYNREHMISPCVRCDYHAIVAEDGRLINRCHSPNGCDKIDRMIESAYRKEKEDGRLNK